MVTTLGQKQHLLKFSVLLCCLHCLTQSYRVNLNEGLPKIEHPPGTIQFTSKTGDLVVNVNLKTVTAEQLASLE